MDVTEDGQCVRYGYREPNMLHTHLVLRGIPGQAIVEGFEMKGPAIGEEFNMKGQGEEKDGFRKVAWMEAEFDVYKAELQKLLRPVDDFRFHCPSSLSLQ